jgi:hypothetical protein
MYRFVHGVLAYLVPTFALGFIWHLMIETAFTIVQWAMVAPLTAWALRSPDHAVSGAR